MPTDTAKLSVAEFNRIARERMPFFAFLGLRIESLTRERVVMRAEHRDEFLRPGGTVAGPIMMGLADSAFYAVILANLGPIELAVTTNLSINFLRKPPPGDLLCSAGLLKLGKRLAVCECGIYKATAAAGTSANAALDADALVAHATGTYSIPSQTG
ncbi:MAG: PaaI family thioesterase [bacterium]